MSLMLGLLGIGVMFASGGRAGVQVMVLVNAGNP